MNTAIIKSAGNFIVKHTAKIQKHSPEILVVTGVVGAVASAVMACKATLKVDEVVGDAKDKIDVIHESLDKGETPAGLAYSEDDHKKDLAMVYAQTGLKFVKLYAPSVALGALSIASILGGHNILRKRNIALAAAYTALDGSFKDYRKRVIERFGDTVDRELKYNLKAKKITEAIVGEDGKEKKEKVTAEIVEDPTSYSDYARFYDDGCTGWTKDPEYNLMFLKAQQQYANDLLRSRGHLFLNEVYDMLGIPRTKAGQVVGWVYNEDNPVGDNFVDFGLYDIRRQPVRDFVNGYERVILLDFNVDGVIYDLI